MALDWHSHVDSGLCSKRRQRLTRLQIGRRLKIEQQLRDCRSLPLPYSRKFSPKKFRDWKNGVLQSSRHLRALVPRFFRTWGHVTEWSRRPRKAHYSCDGGTASLWPQTEVGPKSATPGSWGGFGFGETVKGQRGRKSFPLKREEWALMLWVLGVAQVHLSFAREERIWDHKCFSD